MTAALEPRRHGAHPGDDKAPDAHVLVHDSNLERQCIMQTLAHYDGEPVIVGDALAQRWAPTHKIDSRNKPCRQPGGGDPTLDIHPHPA